LVKEMKLVRGDCGIHVRAVYRQCAVSYTDFGSAYEIVFPQKRHSSVAKDTALTNYIEIFNNTMSKKYLGGEKNSFLL
jgi:hypothetical protein